MSIKLQGVTTNNLKNIDIEIPYNKITAIVGVSGGGKSSLAYDSLHSICNQEFKSIESGYFEDAKYLLKNHSGLIPSVAIRQLNRNTNPRSTLYSYLNISSILSSLRDEAISNIPISKLKLNNPNNECKSCRGLGYENKIDENKIVDFTCRVIENPFFPWRQIGNDKKFKLLLEFCKENSIDATKSLRDLSEEQRQLLLYAESNKEFEVNFKHNGKNRKRKLFFTGIITEILSLNESNNTVDRTTFDKFSKRCVCNDCNGSRINKAYENYHVYGLDVKTFLTSTVKKLASIKTNSLTSPAEKKLHSILFEINDLGLGHLTLSRSIPSLSGGELQKLNFSKLLNSEISNILIVIDEISSQIHVSDFKNIYFKLERIIESRNTIVLVEHCDYFIDRSDVVIAIGPEAGKNGGELIPYEKNEEKVYTERKIVDFNKIILPKIWKNNVAGLSIQIPEGAITTICGRSGSGKSSFAEGLYDCVDNVIYINQEPIRGNIRSTIASFLELNNTISEFFECKLSIDKSYFTPSSGSKGACITCDGKGILSVERSYEKNIEMLCPSCNGLLFSEETDEFMINGKTIKSLYNTPMNEIDKLEMVLPNKISRYISAADDLGIGHLSLNRKTQTLSGGEIKRLKLLKSITTRKVKSILIVDEPGAGLDDISAKKVMLYMNKIKTNYKSIIIIDHKKSIFMESDYLIEFGTNFENKNTEVQFEGTPFNYFFEKYNSYI